MTANSRGGGGFFWPNLHSVLGFGLENPHWQLELDIHLMCAVQNCDSL